MIIRMTVHANNILIIKESRYYFCIAINHTAQMKTCMMPSRDTVYSHDKCSNEKVLSSNWRPQEVGVVDVEGHSWVPQEEGGLDSSLVALNTPPHQTARPLHLLGRSVDLA